MYYPCSENKGADLRLCFRICKYPVFSRRGSFVYVILSVRVELEQLQYFLKMYIILHICLSVQAVLVSGTTGKAIPLTLFGVVTFIAGLLTLLLPETLKRKMPETIEDAENFTR